ncbi:hypothetical protein BDW22DRAFT_1431812 [Trametopsis cervina]|nr:hypothetical protein BDW22DRAFT_1431812 [Trametopsis cervina]
MSSGPGPPLDSLQSHRRTRVAEGSSSRRDWRDGPSLPPYPLGSRISIHQSPPEQFIGGLLQAATTHVHEQTPDPPSIDKFVDVLGWTKEFYRARDLKPEYLSQDVLNITISFLNHLYERHDSMLNDLVDAAICKQKTRFGVCLEAEDFDEIYKLPGYYVNLYEGRIDLAGTGRGPQGVEDKDIPRAPRGSYAVKTASKRPSAPQKKGKAAEKQSNLEIVPARSAPASFNAAIPSPCNADAVASGLPDQDSPSVTTAVTHPTGNDPEPSSASHGPVDTSRCSGATSVPSVNDASNNAPASMILNGNASEKGIASDTVAPAQPTNGTSRLVVTRSANGGPGTVPSDRTAKGDPVSPPRKSIRGHPFTPGIFSSLTDSRPAGTQEILKSLEIGSLGFPRAEVSRSKVATRIAESPVPLYTQGVHGVEKPKEEETAHDNSGDDLLVVKPDRVSPVGPQMRTDAEDPEGCRDQEGSEDIPQPSTVATAPIPAIQPLGGQPKADHNISYAIESVTSMEDKAQIRTVFSRSNSEDDPSFDDHPRARRPVRGLPQSAPKLRTPKPVVDPTKMGETSGTCAAATSPRRSERLAGKYPPTASPLKKRRLEEI